MLPGLWRLFSVRFVWHCCLPVRQETLRPVFKSSKCIFNLSQVLALPCSWMHRFMCARSVSAILLRDWWYQINNSIQSAKLSPAKCESHGGDNTALYQSITRARAHMNAAHAHAHAHDTLTRCLHILLFCLGQYLCAFTKHGLYLPVGPFSMSDVHLPYPFLEDVFSLLHTVFCVSTAMRL